MKSSALSMEVFLLYLPVLSGLECPFVRSASLFRACICASLSSSEPAASVLSKLIVGPHSFVVGPPYCSPLLDLASVADRGVSFISVPSNVVATPCNDDQESPHILGENSENVPAEGDGTLRFHFLLGLTAVCDLCGSGGWVEEDLEAFVEARGEAAREAKVDEVPLTVNGADEGPASVVGSPSTEIKRRFRGRREALVV